MVQIDVSKISSKGQVVIPARLRGRYKEGENIIFIDDGKNLILKKETEMDKSLREDIEFAKRTEQGWKDIEEGRSTNVEFEEFIKKIKDDPEVGKPMKYDRKGTREVYSGSFRLSYLYDKNKDLIYFVAFYHKDEQ